ncbi:protein EMBRYO DEFECTIVE 1674 [Mercurialis annua]|uniref:protein EMBRYO DEFECTIVE 1674 n=1 Tax=Mercurialis annua TaxID=3986 RepID=UPI00215FA028|nr:protein EMBRYO DEFECTIVE 1674 [Mercurialis annua]
MEAKSCLCMNDVLLHDWWLLKSHINRISLAGSASRHGRLGEIVFFSSTPICRRIDATTVETTDGITITVSGMLNRSRTHQNGIPFKVCNLFQLGFPHHWEEVVAQMYNEGESVKKDTSSEKSGFLRRKKSSGTSAVPSILDDVPARRIRDLVMRHPEDSEKFICGDILERFKERTPGAADADLGKGSAFTSVHNDADENIRSNKESGVAETPSSKVRSSGRLKIRKDYTHML